MDSLAFDTVTGYLAAFSSLFLSVSVFMHSNRNTQKLLGAFGLLFIGVALGGRSFYWEKLQELYPMTVDRGENIHYATLFILVGIHGLAGYFFSENQWRVRGELRRLGVFAVASIFMSGILFVGGVAIISASQFYLAVALIWSCLLVFSSMSTQIRAISRAEGSTPVVRLERMNFQHFSNQKSSLGSLYDQGQKHP